MQQKSFILLVVIFVVVVSQKQDKYRDVKAINPIARYWAQARLRRKLPLLDTLAAKSRQEGGDGVKYRNCFFSPVQCQLPVVLEKDPLVTALKINEPTDFLRFRRVWK